jgi:hypothetical protein
MYRIEPGLAYEGEMGDVLKPPKGHHGPHLKATRSLKEGTPITRIVTEMPPPKFYPDPQIHTVAFRSEEHARRWFTLTDKEDA